MDDLRKYRRLWAAVALTVLYDAWREVRAAKGDAGKIAAIRQRALLYFRSADGKTVLDRAGITADASQMADAAVDLTAYDRTIFARSDEMEA